MSQEKLAIQTHMMPRTTMVSVALPTISMDKSMMKREKMWTLTRKRTVVVSFRLSCLKSLEFLMGSDRN